MKMYRPELRKIIVCTCEFECDTLSRKDGTRSEVLAICLFALEITATIIYKDSASPRFLLTADEPNHRDEHLIFETFNKRLLISGIVQLVASLASCTPRTFKRFVVLTTWLY